MAIMRSLTWWLTTVMVSIALFTKSDKSAADFQFNWRKFECLAKNVMFAKSKEWYFCYSRIFSSISNNSHLIRIALTLKWQKYTLLQYIQIKSSHWLSCTKTYTLFKFRGITGIKVGHPKSNISRKLPVFFHLNITILVSNESSWITAYEYFHNSMATGFVQCGCGQSCKNLSCKSPLKLQLRPAEGSWLACNKCP